MKIIYLHQYFNTPEMSGSTRSFEMARRLVSKGHNVTMITSWREKDNRTDCFDTDESGIKVHWIPVPYSNHMKYSERIKAFLYFAWKASLKAGTSPADVVFATSTPLTIALPGVYAARRQKIPMIFEIRDLWPEIPIAVGALRNPVLKWAARRLEIFAYQNAEKIVALSPGMRDGVVKTGFSASKVEIIPNSSDLDYFNRNECLRQKFRKKHHIDDRTILVVYAGTFGKINGVEYLARLADVLRDEKSFHFLAIGEGQEFEKVESFAKQVGVQGHNFSMLPSIPKSEMPEVLSAADIAISTVIPVPELEANSANKVFDGLAAGCCIAINHGGWLAQLLESENAGLQLDNNPELAAQQLQAFVAVPGALEKAGKNARRLAEMYYSREILADKLENVLLAAVQRI